MPLSLASRLGSNTPVRLPSPHLGLRWDSAQAEDVLAIVELVETYEAESAAVRRTPEYEIRNLALGGFDNGQVTAIVGKDSHDKVQAFAAVFCPDDSEVARAELFAVTATDWHHKGIGRALLAWQDAVARRMLKEIHGENSPLPIRISNVVDEHLKDRRLLYACAGFSPKRDIGVFFNDLTVDSGVQLPSTQRLVAWNDVPEEELRELYVISKGRERVTRAEALKWWTRVRRLVSADLSFAVRNEAGELVAAAATCLHSNLWRSAGKNDGVIDLVAMRSLDYIESLEALVSHISAMAHRDGLSGLTIEAVVTQPTTVDVRLMRLGYHRIGTRKLYAIDM